jgi:hypothetical protein
MIVTSEIRKAIVFFGLGEAPDAITWRGTGFLVSYKERQYLITCAHNVRSIGVQPFWVRVNSSTAEPALVASGNPAEVPWVFHPDVSVDLAIVPFGANHEEGRAHRYIPEAAIATRDRREKEGIGLGDMTYTCGLFSRLSGKSNNLPLLHFGNIAAQPTDGVVLTEVIVDDLGNTRRVEAERFVVQTHSLRGLSGSPVFVRPTVRIDEIPWRKEQISVLLPRAAIYLLGVWTSAFDERPTETLASELALMNDERPAPSVRVPIGMGLVTPADRIVELLEQEPLKREREAILKTPAEGGGGT